MAERKTNHPMPCCDVFSDKQFIFFLKVKVQGAYLRKHLLFCQVSKQPLASTVRTVAFRLFSELYCIDGSVESTDQILPSPSCDPKTTEQQLDMYLGGLIID